MSEVLKAKDVMKIGLRGYKEIVPVNWHGKIINVRYLLPREEAFDLMRDISDMCMIDEDEVVGEFVDFAVRLNIVMKYAGIELPENIDDIYVLLYHSDIYDVVLNNANKAQVMSVVKYFEPWGALNG